MLLYYYYCFGNKISKQQFLLHFLAESRFQVSVAKYDIMHDAVSFLLARSLPHPHI